MNAFEDVTSAADTVLDAVTFVVTSALLATKVFDRSVVIPATIFILYVNNFFLSKNKLRKNAIRLRKRWTSRTDTLMRKVTIVFLIFETK
jgi:hypothetical protein